jgi:hypothetical protein
MTTPLLSNQELQRACEKYLECQQEESAAQPPPPPPPLHDELNKAFLEYIARASAAVTQGEAHKEVPIPVAPPPYRPTNLLTPRVKSEPDASNPKDILGLKKPPLRLVPPALLILVAKVMGLGAKKYGPYNWRTLKVRKSVYLEAAMRHLLAAMDGEDADPESGIPHEAHVAACMGILLDAQALGVLIDDRPPKGPAAALIKKHTEAQ